MTSISKGGNAPLDAPLMRIEIATQPGVDLAAMRLTASGHVRGDGDMCFFNQPELDDGAVRMSIGEGGTVFEVDLAAQPAEIEKIVLTATRDVGAFGDGTGIPITLSAAGDATHLTVEVPTAGRSEAVLILAELYRRQGAWKLRHVGQGFDGGLKALAEHFGVDVAEEDAPAAAPASETSAPAQDARAARLVSLEKSDPALVSLAKKATVSLEKKGGRVEPAKVCMVLDISGSMKGLFQSGKIDTLVTRALALGLTFDDDGVIDVFLFGRNVHDYGTVSAEDYRGFSAEVMRRHPFEGDTRYGLTMERVRRFYAADNSGGLPVFVLFVTDGSTSDKPKTKRELVASSREPIFWKFMGLIPDNRYAEKRTGYLQELDDLPGRKVDNADFFNVTDPAAPDEGAFFDEVMEEYPEWLREARRLGIVAA